MQAEYNWFSISISQMDNENSIRIRININKFTSISNRLTVKLVFVCWFECVFVCVCVCVFWARVWITEFSYISYWYCHCRALLYQIAKLYERYSIFFFKKKSFTQSWRQFELKIDSLVTIYVCVCDCIINSNS